MSQIIAGRHAVYHALKAGRRPVRRIWISQGGDDRSLSELRGLAEQRNVPIERAERRFFAQRVSVENHQGIAAEVAELGLLSLADLLTTEPQRVLLLDKIQDPQNLGALLRSAYAFGMEGVIFTKHESAPLSPVAIKAAAGAVEYLPLCRVPRLAGILDPVKEAGLWLYGGVAAGGENLWEQDLTSRIALVIGGEGEGLHQLVRRRCDHLVQIPLNEASDSLNASVAGGVLMAELARQQSLASTAKTTRLQR